MFEGPYSVEIPFWDGLAEGVLRQTRCAACKEWHWPPVPRCPNCGSFDHEWVEIEPRGQLQSWTTIHRAFAPNLEGQTPFTVALIELPDAGDVRILGRFEGPVDDLEVGQSVIGRIAAASPVTLDYPTVVWSVADDGAAGTNGHNAGSAQ